MYENKDEDGLNQTLVHPKVISFVQDETLDQEGKSNTPSIVNYQIRVGKNSINTRSKVNTQFLNSMEPNSPIGEQVQNVQLLR